MYLRLVWPLLLLPLPTVLMVVVMLVALFSSRARTLPTLPKVVFLLLALSFGVDLPERLSVSMLCPPVDRELVSVLVLVLAPGFAFEFELPVLVLFILVFWLRPELWLGVE